MLGWFGAYGIRNGSAQAPPAPSPSCESQLKQSQVEVQILTQGRAVAERQWAAVVIQVETLTQENATLKQQADGKKALPTPDAPKEN